MEEKQSDIIDKPEFDELEELQNEALKRPEQHGDLLTLEEMKDLLRQEPYKLAKYEQYETELLYDEKSRKYYTDYFKEPYGDHILLRHILAELCVMHKSELDWERVTGGYDMAILADIVGLYYTPLAWCKLPHSLTQKFIIVGKFAKEVEEKRPGHEDLIDFLLNEAREKRAVWFVDHMPACGIPEWENFLTNYPRADLLKALEPDKDYLFHLPKPNKASLEENLEYVIAHRGFKRAQEVLDKLRQEWNHLVKLKLCKFNELNGEEIEALREYVFDSVNYQIDLWRMEAGDQDENAVALEQKEPQAPKMCRYICAEKIKETGVKTVEEYIQELEDSCVSAPNLADTLLRGKKLGYLNFHGDGKSAIYKHLKECYPGKIKFGYTNFTLYFK